MPNGQHLKDCIASRSVNGWRSSGPLSRHYNANCSGCQSERAGSLWGSKNSESAILGKTGTALVGGAVVLNKGMR